MAPRRRAAAIREIPHDMETVQDLVCKARDGDLGAYTLLVHRFREASLSQARRVMGDYHLAEDAVQEAFVIAYRDLQ